MDLELSIRPFLRIISHVYSFQFIFPNPLLHFSSRGTAMRSTCSRSGFRFTKSQHLFTRTAKITPRMKLFWLRFYSVDVRSNRAQCCDERYRLPSVQNHLSGNLVFCSPGRGTTGLSSMRYSTLHFDGFSNGKNQRSVGAKYAFCVTRRFDVPRIRATTDSSP